MQPFLQLNAQAQQRQEQVQTLSTAQLQSLAMLQTNLQDLQQQITQEIAVNPCLEVLSNGLEIPSGDLSQPVVSDREQDLDRAADFAEKDESYAEQACFDTHSDEGFDSSLGITDKATADKSPSEAREYFFNSLTVKKRSIDELESAIAELASSKGVPPVLVDAVIDNLDPQRGWLCASDDDLTAITAVPKQDVHEFVRLLQQKLEPPGMVAHDLRECLLLQLERNFERDSIPWKIIDTSLDDLLYNRIPLIAQRLDCTIAEINGALPRIRELTPWPGRVFDDETAQTVIPEATVLKINGQWGVQMNQDAIPRLAVSQTYQDMLTGKQSVQDKEARKYLKTNLDRAAVFVNAIEQRQNTIQAVTLFIVSQQQAFFDGGSQYLRPMTRSDVATALDYSDSTISRATANKYLRTPQGLLPYSYFFSTGYQNAAGESDTSAEAIRQKIQDLVKNEPPTAPYSDQKIADLLKEAGQAVARRTVAKYREALQILPASQRKKYE